MRTAVHVDDPQAVHELADHVDGGRELHHRDWPDARHDDRQPRRPALADVVAIDLAFLLRLLRRVVVDLRFRRQLEPGRRREAEPIVRPAGMQPHAGQIERRLRPRLGQVGWRQRAERGAGVWAGGAGACARPG